MPLYNFSFLSHLFGHNLAVHGICSWLCIKESVLAGLEGPYVILGDKKELVECKASAIPTVLYFSYLGTSFSWIFWTYLCIPLSVKFYLRDLMWILCLWLCFSFAILCRHVYFIFKIFKINLLWNFSPWFYFIWNSFSILNQSNRSSSTDNFWVIFFYEPLFVSLFLITMIQWFFFSTLIFSILYIFIHILCILMLYFVLKVNNLIFGYFHSSVESFFIFYL